MSLRHGAVGEMIQRLLRAGYTPSESQIMAEAAYLKEHERPAGSPRPVIDRPLITWEINKTLRELGDYRTGPASERTRIALWNTIFGRGSYRVPAELENLPGMAEFNEVLAARGRQIPTTPRPQPRPVPAPPPPASGPSKVGFIFGLLALFLFSLPVVGPMICGIALGASAIALDQTTPGSPTREKVFAGIGLGLGILYGVLAAVDYYG